MLCCHPMTLIGIACFWWSFLTSAAGQVEISPVVLTAGGTLHTWQWLGLQPGLTCMQILYSFHQPAKRSRALSEFLSHKNIIVLWQLIFTGLQCTRFAKETMPANHHKPSQHSCYALSLSKALIFVVVEDHVWAKYKDSLIAFVSWMFQFSLLCDHQMKLAVLHIDTNSIWWTEMTEGHSKDKWW